MEWFKDQSGLIAKAGREGRNGISLWAKSYGKNGTRRKQYGLGRASRKGGSFVHKGRRSRIERPRRDERENSGEQGIRKGRSAAGRRK